MIDHSDSPNENEHTAPACAKISGNANAEMTMLDVQKSANSKHGDVALKSQPYAFREMTTGSGASKYGTENEKNKLFAINADLLYRMHAIF